MILSPEKTDRWLRGLLLAVAASIPVSIALAQSFGYLALLVWVLRVVRRRSWKEIWRNPFFPWVVLFILLAVAVSIQGVRPDVSLGRLRRLSMLSFVFMIPMLFAGREDGWRGVPALLAAFLAGSALLGIIDLVRVPLEVSRGVLLYDTGNMRDPQMYLVALCLLLAGAPLVASRRERFLWWGLVLLHAVGLVLHFKRGALLALPAAALLMAVRARRWTAPAVVLLVLVLSLAFPAVRTRLGALRLEASARHGGRAALWTCVAPQLFREYPMGMGFLGTRHEDFVGRGCYIEPGLNHLHNNMLQVLAELGSAGLALWITWMIAAGVLLWRAAAPPKPGVPPGWAAAALGCWGAFCGLMLNGLVEYNFGNSVILMLLAVLMGLAVLLNRRDLPGRP